MLHGLPESFAPARLRYPTRMFPGEGDNKWEPYKVRGRTAEEKMQLAGRIHHHSDPSWVADLDSSDGAVYPLQQGRVVNWSCFYAFLEYLYVQLGPPLHTPILFVTPPVFTQYDLESLTSFCFEKFRSPAFSFIDSSLAVCYGMGVSTGLVVDVGFEKADVTAITDFIISAPGRGASVPGIGGNDMTKHLLSLLRKKGWTRNMCEQLKRSPICEVLPPGIPLPGSDEEMATPNAFSSAALSNRASANAAHSASKPPPAMVDGIPSGTQSRDGVEDGVLDIAQIVAAGKTNEFLARKEKEKEKAEKAVKKAGQAADAAKARLSNSKRPRNSFWYALNPEDNRSYATEEEKRPKPDETDEPMTDSHDPDGPAPSTTFNPDVDPSLPCLSRPIPLSGRQELEVGHERFRAASSSLLETLAATIHRTVSAVEDPAQRHILWENLIVCGNGSRVRGFKDALFATLNQRYLIYSGATTVAAAAAAAGSTSGFSGLPSEQASRFASPLATGANTPLPGGREGAPIGGGSGVNPLLLAATTASNPALAQHLSAHAAPSTPPSRGTPQPALANASSAYGGAGGGPAGAGAVPVLRQHPICIRSPKMPEYFPEWKDVGEAEVGFLGAQVAAKVGFLLDGAAGGVNRSYVSRIDYNEGGPGVVHEIGY